MSRLIKIFGGVLIAISVVVAQDSGQSEDDRQIVYRVAPAYPDLAKRAGISGTVKLIVVIGPNGSVKSTEIVGGNPVLITPAKAAVMNWKFSPGSHETKKLIELRFFPNSSGHP
jgi:TonB family protein